MFSLMKPIERYALLLEEVFGIEGVMALAWYTLHAHRLWIEENRPSMRVPILIIEGVSGSGKTELARAIAAIDVPEGLRPNAAIHCLPMTTSGVVRALVNGNASFVVLENLRDGIPDKSIKAIMERKQSGPLLLMTSLDYNGNSVIGDGCIFIHLPHRSFTRRAHERLDELNLEMKKAFHLKDLLYNEPSDHINHNICAWQGRLKEEAKKMGLEVKSIRSQEIIRYYALIIGHWQGMEFSSADLLHRMAEYAYRCLSLRLPEDKERKRKVLQLTKGKGDRISLTWRMPDGHRQRIRFENEEQYKGFVCMLHMMESTGACSVDISV